MEMATRRTAAGMLAAEVVRSTAVAMEVAAIVVDVMVMIAEAVEAAEVADMVVNVKWSRVHLLWST